MKLNFKKITLLGLVMTLCLAGLGVGYAGWFETINISGTAIVEFMAVEWIEQETNDPEGMPQLYDPDGIHNNGDEIWIIGADESVLEGFIGDPFRLNKDVGRTECILRDLDEDTFRETIEFNIYNAYPCYYGKLIGQLKNKGSAWIQVDTITVTYPDYPEFNFTIPTTAPVPGPWPHPPGFEVKWSDGSILPIKIGPYEYPEKAMLCHVHILQAAEQGAVYRFNMTFNISGPVAPPTP